MAARRSDPLTGDLFTSIPQPLPEHPESMDFRTLVAQMCAEMIQGAPDSRWAIAARMSELSGVETSKALLDSYTAASREECNLPFWKAPLIELATGNRRLAEWHASVLGGRVLWGRDVLDAELGKVQRQIEELRDQERAMRVLRRRVR